MAESNRYVNEFKSGIDSDTTHKDIENTVYRDAINMSSMEHGNTGAMTLARGTTFLEELIDPPGSNFRVLDSLSSYGNMLPVCDFTDDPPYEKRLGIVYFCYDDTNFGYIVFYDIRANKVYPLYPSAANQSQNQLNFDASQIVDAKPYSDGDNYFVYWVDNKNIFRFIEVRQRFGGNTTDPCTIFPFFKELSVRKLHPVDCLEYKAVVVGGNLVSGSYAIMYRWWNRSNCNHSGWSNITNPIPIVPDDGACVNDGHTVFGGYVGEPTNKAIELVINNGLGMDAFTTIQLLVIKNTDGSTNDQTTGFLLSPRLGTYLIGQTITYTGFEPGITVDLGDILVDHIPVIGGKTMVITDQKVFIGGPIVRDFEMDNGNVVDIDLACTIRRVVGSTVDFNSHKCEDHNVNNHGHFRDELYVYGVFVYDEFGNGVVCPIDLFKFNADWIFAEEIGQTIVVSVTNNIYTLTTPLTDQFEVGDILQVGETYNVTIVEIINNATVLAIYTDTGAGSLPIGYVGQTNILLGQKGNQGTTHGWKYAKRSDNQFSLINEDGDIEAIGLRLEGLKNWPSWARGFEIVRRPRKKNIIQQIVHIPTIAVQGVNTWYIEDVDDEVEYDYDGELDYVFPKVHRMGHARNIHRTKIEGILQPSQGGSTPIPILELPEWCLQDDTVGEGEVSSLIYANVPEYMYNVLGDPSQSETENIEGIDPIFAGGTKAEIVDAVQFIWESRYTAMGERKDDEFVQRVGLFRAWYRNNYFYNREGYIIENNAKSYFKLIEDTVGFNSGEYIVANNIPVDYSINLPHGHGPISLPYAPMTGEQYSSIRLYGNVQALAIQQGKHESINDRWQELFWAVHTNQRGTLVKLKEKLEDFTRLMIRRKLNANDDYFPLEPWIANPDGVSDDPVNSAELVTDNSLGAPLGTPARTQNSNAQAPGEVACGAYILNLTKGLGDGRYGLYGEISDNWIRTGTCQPITALDIEENTSFNVEVFGGDCFINKHTFKVVESGPRIVQYDPIDSQTDIPGGANQLPKTGAWEKHIEIMDVYLESTVNAAYTRLVGQYPAKNDNSIVSFEGFWNYYLNPGYNFTNTLKVFVQKQEFCVPKTQLKNSLIWSDPRVRGASGNPFFDVDGFDTFRVNNIWTLDGKYGEIKKILANDDKALHIWQESRIAFQPIGVDELQTVDGALIATGTGKVLGSGDYYIQRDVGTQHPQTILIKDGIFYGTDVEQDAIYAFGSRGSDFRYLNLERGNAMVRSFLSDEIPENDLKAHYDDYLKRVIIHGNFANPALVYNTKGRYWETRLQTQIFQSGHSEIGMCFWVRNGEIFEVFRTGLYGGFFGQFNVSSVTVYSNPLPNETKVFTVVQLNSIGRASSVRCQIFNENGSVTQDTGELTLDALPVNHQYFTNKLRSYDVATGRSRKMVGEYMQLRLSVSPQVTDGGAITPIIYSLITKFRRSY